MKNPNIDKVRSYLLAQDDGFRSELLAEYLRRSDPSPELYSLFIDYYTVTDYGAGAYEVSLLQKVFSGRSEEQIAETAEVLADYPDVVSIYRGEAEGSTPYHKAFSWTLDINTAFFFACRHGDHDHARIIRAKVRKPDIMAAFLERGEKEVIILPGAPFEVSKEKLIGPSSPAVMPPRYIDLYAVGREQIKELYHRRAGCQCSLDSSGKSNHDAVHSARVLFLAYSILKAGKIKLTPTELEQLRTAIVYHDIGRCDDAADESHGFRSQKEYERKGTDPAIAFLIHYHCIDDKVSKSQLESSEIKSKNRIWLLYQIIKDADALDRVRFGLAHLDVNYLRLSISHKLGPLAMAAIHGIKL